MPLLAASLCEVTSLSPFQVRLVDTALGVLVGPPIAAALPTDPLPGFAQTAQVGDRGLVGNDASQVPTFLRPARQQLFSFSAGTWFGTGAWPAHFIQPMGVRKISPMIQTEYGIVTDPARSMVAGSSVGAWQLPLPAPVTIDSQFWRFCTTQESGLPLEQWMLEVFVINSNSNGYPPNVTTTGTASLSMRYRVYLRLITTPLAVSLADYQSKVVNDWPFVYFDFAQDPFGGLGYGLRSVFGYFGAVFFTLHDYITMPAYLGYQAGPVTINGIGMDVSVYSDWTVTTPRLAPTEFVMRGIFATDTETPPEPRLELVAL